jgi:(hydroxyamino)benzene mutase
MNAEQHGIRQGHRLIQIGVLLFLLTCIEGFFVQSFASPKLGRSVHTLAGFEGVVLITLGLIWPRLRLAAAAAAIAFWTLVYSTLATLAIFALAAIWGAGASVIPIAAEGARGSDAQEAILTVITYTAGPTALIAFALILSGLRGPPATA